MSIPDGVMYINPHDRLYRYQHFIIQAKSSEHAQRMLIIYIKNLKKEIIELEEDKKYPFPPRPMDQDKWIDVCQRRIKLIQEDLKAGVVEL